MSFKRRPFLENRENIEIKWFKEQWGRDPKIWTVEDLYNLWLKAKKRSQLRYKQRRDCIDEIIEKITSSSFTHNRRGEGDDTYIVYYKNVNNVFDEDRLYKTNIRYEQMFECYSTSDHGYVGESENIAEKRNDVIDSMLDGDLRLELGTKLKKLDRLSNTWFPQIVFRNLWYIIESKLKESKIKDPVFPISICGNEYYVITNLENPYSLKYELIDKSSRELIKF